MATTETATTQSTMFTAANSNLPPDVSPDDVIRRNILRELPCRITDEEFNRISKERVAKEAERDELQAELAVETKKRKAQIEDLDDEIKKKGRELHTGFQDRTVKCIDVFLRAPDGVGYVQTLRTDTWKEVERRAASAHETQRHLKGVEDAPSGGILDEARKRQRSAQAEEGNDVPPEAPAGDDVPSEDGAEASDEGGGEGDEKPARRKRDKKAEQ